jgi:prepilin-type N-terminal cleavage/methylation domain-containing protein
MNKIKGFTLVELLIVIALLGVLAAAVLAAINPLEQANRARDTRMRSDASQLLAAIDRYFVTQDKFPWVGTDAGYVANNDITFGFANAASIPVGLCGDAACGTDGSLINNNELKTEFRNRDFIVKGIVVGPGGETEALYVGKATGASSSVYACWVPKSKSERQKATKTLTLGSTTLGTATDCAAATKTYSGIANSCVVCLPQ